MEISENGKRAIEQFRNCSQIEFAVKVPQGLHTVLSFALLLNNVQDNSPEFFGILKLAYDKNYWLTDKIKKEENK